MVRMGTPRAGVISKSVLLSIAFLQTLALPTTLSAQSNSLSEPTRRVVFDGTAFYGPTTVMPYWDKGFLISREAEISQPGIPNVKLYDRDGVNIRRAAIWFPGSARVTVRSAAVTSDGRIVASGSAYKADGTRAKYIALTDLRGDVTNVIQTGDYHPSNVCVAPDGTVWSFGATDWDEATDRPTPGDVLRHFDFRKGQIGSFIPRSAFPDRPQYDVVTHIRCLADRVVVYTYVGETYIELEYSSNTPQAYRVVVPPGFHVPGFGVLKPGKVYGHLARLGNSDRSADGLYFMAFDATTKQASWVSIAGAIGPRTRPGTVTELWGADMESLVITRAGDPAGALALLWATPSDR